MAFSKMPVKVQKQSLVLLVWWFSDQLRYFIINGELRTQSGWQPNELINTGSTSCSDQRGGEQGSF